jgi:hypothetical protein
MSYKLGVLFCTLIICLDVLAIAPTLRSQHGDTCIYDDGSVIKSIGLCPFRLELEKPSSKKSSLKGNFSDDYYRSQAESQKMRQDAFNSAMERMGRGLRGLTSGDRRTPQEIQASAIIQKQQKQKQVFAKYLSKKYPNSGLDILALEGIVTPENFKDFLTE